MKLTQRIRKIAAVAVTVLGMAGVVTAFQLVACAGAASAQTLPPTLPPETIDVGWGLLEQYGPVWGGMWLMFQLVSYLLKRNESTHWIAQGRTLAIIVAVLGIATAALTAKFAGTPWPGVLITAVVALFKLIQPTVPPAPLPDPVPAVRGTEAGFVRLLLLVMTAGIAFGIASQAMWLGGCASTKYRAGEGAVAFLDCESPHVDAQLLADAKLVARAAVEKLLSGEGTIDTSALKADAKPLKTDLMKCAFDAVLAAITAKPEAPAPDAPMARTRAVDPAQISAAWAQVRGELGWPAAKAVP